jgi:hypothetical protein
MISSKIASREAIFELMETLAEILVIPTGC